MLLETSMTALGKALALGDPDPPATLHLRCA
jgi:hypothetical protein